MLAPHLDLGSPISLADHRRLRKPGGPGATAALEDGGLSTAALLVLTQKGLPEVGAESQGYGTPRPFPSRRAGAWDGLSRTGPEPAPLRAG